MRGAPFELRPCKARKPLKIRDVASVERYILMGAEIYPPLISRLRDSFPPRGSLLRRFFSFFHSRGNEWKFRVSFAVISCSFFICIKFAYDVCTA